MRRCVLAVLCLVAAGCSSLTIHLKIKTGQVEAVRSYLAGGGQVDKASEIRELSLKGVSISKGDTPLETAIRANRYEIVKMLVDAGADVKRRLSGGQPTYLFVSARKDPRITKLLIDKGVDVHAKTRSGETAMLGHVLSGSLESVKALLKAGAKVNLRGFRGVPYFISAVYLSDNVAMLKLMLENGAKVDVQDRKKKQAIHFANTKEEVAFLVKHGADVNAKDENWDTPAHERILAGKKGVEAIVALAKNGANLNAENNSRQTALHHAAAKGNKWLIDALAKNGANINAQDHAGNTPLHIAVWVQNRLHAADPVEALEPRDQEQTRRDSPPDPPPPYSPLSPNFVVGTART